MATTRGWQASWIAGTSEWVNTGREDGADLRKFVRSAPWLRRRFVLAALPEKAVCYLCSAGWHELYVNGRKADDRVLAPCMSQFDVHVNYVTYDLTKLLKAGDNAVTVLLGNGAFNAQTADTWDFHHAPWRDYPRMLCELVADGQVLLKSDNTWKRAESPLCFDSWRSGEHYDFSREIPGVYEADFDDSSWENAPIVRPPAGTPILEEMEPCRVCETSHPVESRKLDEQTVCYDFGDSFTGWAQIELRLPQPLAEPLEFSLEFSDRLQEDGTADREPIARYTAQNWEFQAARVMLSLGRTHFSWRPHFTYYGFRYVHLRCSALSKLGEIGIQAQFIHNDFASVGDFTSSNDRLNRLQQVIRRSFLTNFTGIPTDCPHREKLGWTGDHSMAMATGLWNFDAGKAYHNFLRIFADTQRPSGELAPVAPTPAWWWNVGPGFDYFLFQAPWELYRFYGDDSAIREVYGTMHRYLEFTECMEVDGLVEYGLGDWAHPERALGEAKSTRIASTRLVVSAWVYSMWKRFGCFAEMTGHAEDAAWAKGRAEEYRRNIRREFLHADGSVDTHDQSASLACMVFFHLCDKEQEPVLAGRLLRNVRANAYRADFGIFGAKWVPRVLGDFGYAADALEIFLQRDYPGYGYMLDHGATTLWEFWDGMDSRDHTMFGDPSAWCFEYLAGIRPSFENPAFACVELKPNFVPQMDSCQARHVISRGRVIQAGWRRQDGGILYEVSIPEGTRAHVALPGMPAQMLIPGIHSLKWKPSAGSGNPEAHYC